MIRRPCGTSEQSVPLTHHPEGFQAELSVCITDDRRALLLFEQLKGDALFDVFYSDDFRDVVVECFSQAFRRRKGHRIKVCAHGDEMIGGGQMLYLL